MYIFISKEKLEKIVAQEKKILSPSAKKTMNRARRRRRHAGPRAGPGQARPEQEAPAGGAGQTAGGAGRRPARPRRGHRSAEGKENFQVGSSKLAVASSFWPRVCQKM